MKLTIRGTRLFVDIEGAASRWEQGRLRFYPPLFLMHGGPGANHLRLKRDVGYLREWFQLVFIDERGCGQSDKCAKRTLTLGECVEDMEAIRAVLGFDRISVLGWSYGGMLAAEYAARYPQWLDLLFLLSTTGSGDFIRASREWLAEHGTPAQQAGAEWMFRRGYKTLAEFVEKGKVLGPLNVRRPVPGAPVQWNLAALNRAMLEDLPKWNVLPKLRRVKAPTFMAVGRHDWICPVSQSLALARALPQAELHIYQHSAHYPATDEPRRFRRDIAAFIRRARSAR